MTKTLQLKRPISNFEGINMVVGSSNCYLFYIKIIFTMNSFFYDLVGIIMDYRIIDYTNGCRG